MSEALLQSKVMKYLKAQPNIWAVKVIQANVSGVPHIIGAKGFKFFAIELKNPNGKGKTTALQQYNVDKLSDIGANILVSHDYLEVTQFIQAI